MLEPCLSRLARVKKGTVSQEPSIQLHGFRWYIVYGYALCGLGLRDTAGRCLSLSKFSVAVVA